MGSHSNDASVSPVKRALLERIERHRQRRAAQAAPIPALRSARYPLSQPQQRLWFLDRMEGPNAVYNMAFSLRIDGALDVAALATAIDALVDRHDVLRTVYRDHAGEPCQQVLPELSAHFELVDLADLDPARCAAERDACTRRERAHPFDLAAEAPLRTVLLRLPGSRYELLLTLHHIAGDGWSLNVLVGDLLALYKAARDGGEPGLPPLPVQYGDYARWQRQQSQQHDDDLAYWREQLQHAPAVLGLRSDRPRPAKASYRGGLWSAAIDAETCRRIEALASASAATPFMVMVAAFDVLLLRYSQQADIVVGTPLANRDRAETTGLVGFFVNTLPLRVQVDAQRSFRDLLATVRTAAQGLYEHQSIAFDQLVDALKPERSLAHAPFFQVCFGLNNTGASPSIRLDDLGIQVLQTGGEVAKYDLSVSLNPDGDGLTGYWEYATDLFDEASIAAMSSHYLALLKGVLSDPDEALERVSMLSPGEAGLQGRWNRTRVEHVIQPLADAMSARAARAPHAIAVVCGDRQISHGALHACACRLARALVAGGVGPEDRVALCLDRTALLPVAMLAIVMAGAAYVPIDPRAPAQRRHAILSDSGAKLLLADAPVAGSACTVVMMDALLAASVDLSPAPLALDYDVDALAYVVYTSGTTGTPKGVAITQANLANLCGWHQRAFDVDASARATQLAGVAFDAMGWEVWPYLTAGASVALLARETIVHGGDLASALRDLRATHAFVPTPLADSLLQALVATPSVDVLLVGGDALAPVESLPEGVRLVNNYGPTETTVVATSGDVAAGRQVPSIGRAIDNASSLVLDGYLQPAPLGVVGELHVGGAGVARGYFGQPALTAERFIPDPLSTVPGARMYRTGDLARWRHDGTLEFAGRRDQQIKIRGHRIELAEIEHALLRHPAVEQAVVVVDAAPRGEAQLVAYIASNGTPDAADLRAHLRDYLPDYMLPAYLVALDRLPMTNNGKVDRGALPPPDRSNDRGRSQEPPQTDSERTLAAIWAEVLKLATVGRHDSFFELGGHSLLAARLVDLLRERFGASPSLRDLWTFPTLKDFAACFDALEARPGKPSGLPRIVHDAARRHAPFELTDIQQAYWLGRSDAFQMGNVAAHAYAEFELRSGLDVAVFEAAFNTLIQRHDMLRMVVEDGRQRILEAPGHYSVPFVDLAGLDGPARDAVLASTRESMAHHVFAAEQWPMFDVRLTRLAPDHLRLYWSFDGLLLDGFSQRLLVAELGALIADPATALPGFEVTFRDYVLGLRQLQETELYEAAKAYWLQRVDALPRGPELPLAMDPAQIEKPRFVRRQWTLPAADWTRLKQRGARAGLTPSALLLAAFAEVLAMWSKTPRFVINLTTFNRLPLHADVERMLGDFTSLTLLEVDRAAGSDFTGRARAIQGRLWSDLEHHHFSGVDVLREIRRRSDGGDVAMPVVFSSMLGTDRDAHGAQPTDAAQAELVFALSQTSQVWLDHQVSEVVDGGLHTAWDAVEDLFPAGLLDAMFDAYRGLVDALASDDACWRREQPLALPAAQAARRRAVNATDEPWSQSLLHQGFRTQAVRNPRALAVVQGGTRLDYGQLAQMARQLARRLRDAGVVPNTLVAVVMHKGWEQIAAVLGILESGAAYLPIDAGLPPARIQQLLAVADVGIALVQGAAEIPLDWPAAVQRWVVDASALADPPEPELASPQQLDDIAYVIFTSGSTGLPKGVVIDHRGAANTVEDINRRLALTTDDRVLALSSLSFDLSVHDIFGLLGAGGAIVLPEPERERDPAHWSELVARHRVTIWNTVPALMQLFVEQHEQQAIPIPGSLRAAMLSGDWIPVTLPDRIRALSAAITVTSLGGATEASIWSIAYPIGEVSPAWSSIPYGTPLANQTYHVLHADLGPCPDWVPGDLYIGGIGLALGYWKDDARTTASFIVHPHTGERLYRTGDMGRYWPDGLIEFLGREDSQVKIQGYRIELGEIESALSRHPDVRDSVVVAVGEAGRHRRLVAYIVPEVASDKQLREALFRLQRPGLRRFGDAAAVQLLSRGDGDGLQLAWTAQGHRADQSFATVPPDLAALGNWLASLAATAVAGAPLPKYHYPSASSLNPVQAYLEVGDGLVAGLAAGVHYHDPERHGLVALGSPCTPGLVHPRLHLVGELEAVVPVYGPDAASAFCELEAGYMAELLQLHGCACGIGLRALPPGLPAPPLQLSPSQRWLASFDIGAIAAPVGARRQRLGALERQSYRRYCEQAIARTALLSLLDAAATPALDLYLYVYRRPNAADGVQDTPAGLYRYAQGDLRRIGEAPAELIAEAVRQGRIDERAAIGIFLVGADNAGNRMVAGAVGQRLMTAGPAYGVGLCPIGGYETRWLGNLIDAQAGTVVHSLVGGLIEPEQTTAWQTEASTRARIADRVRDCLAASLPGYMVPSAFVELDRLPLTANGKVDRRALPAPAPVAAAGHPATARRSNALERKVLDIWEEVLDLRGIDPGSQFFDIGGDSLKIVQVQIRLRSVLKTNVSLRRLYEHQTVESLARLLAEIDPALLAAGSTAPRTSVVAAVSLQQQRRLRIAAMTDEQVACLLAEQRRVPSRGEIEHAI